MILQVKDITKRYGRQTAVDKVSFSIDKGEIVGFLGPNGAGKSTVMKIIAGCLAPDEGDAWIDGLSVKRHPLQTKARIAFLPEDNPLYDEMYVREYLEYVSTLYPKQGNRHDNVSEIIEAVQLQPESRKKIGQLSKGYRQRVGLAQAFLHKPELFILDEPITGLDPRQITETTDFIRNQAKEKAVLFSSHTLSEVSSLCTRIIIIYKGRIVLDKAMADIDNLDLIFKTLTS